jgi:TonB-linked SusC/RagA family outer membrane protein
MQLRATIALRNKELFFKTLVIMKLTALLLLTTALHVSAGGYSQTVTLTAKNVSLEKIFKVIRQQTGYDFWYESALLKKAGNTNVDLKNVPLNQALDAALLNLPLSYKIVGRIIVVKEKEETSASGATDIPIIKYVTVKGRVIDNKTGDPIVGANVLIKGSGKGTSSNKQGEFSITAIDGNRLIVSFVGYETKEVPVSDGETVVVRLTISSLSMKEMVVTGIYSRPKANFTGAATSFTSEELGRVTNGNVLTALKALDPSLQLPENISLGSNPNTLPDVVLRNGNSLVDISQTNKPNPFNYANSPNTPLFILDGFETTLQRINDLDMNRIVKVDILKDAAATAIYGSRAANGVIVIETLRPQSGRLRVTYTGNIEAETPDLSGYDVLNAAEKLDLEQKVGVYKETFGNTEEQLAYFYASRKRAIESGVNTDWLAQPVRTGIGQKHNIYVEGGSQDVQYGIGGTYSNRAGTMKGSSRENITGNSYFSYRYKSIAIRNDFTLAFNKAVHSPYGGFQQYVQLNPYWSPYDSAGNLAIYLEDVRNLDGARLTNFDQYNNGSGQGVGRPLNPLYNAQLNTKDQSTYQNINNNLQAQWQVTQWLRFSGRLAYTRQTDESDLFLPAQHSSFYATATFDKGSYTKGYGKRTRIESMITADVNKRYDNHLFFGTAGLNIQEDKFNTSSYRVIGFTSPNLNQPTLGNRFVDGSKPTGTESLSRLVGFLSNLSYAYDSRYLLDLSWRLDGSSQFGARNTFAPFWSAGIGWNLHNESILKNLHYINRLKLRYSVGYTGSQNFASFLGIPTSQYYTNQDYRGIIGTYLLGYGNPNLQWQKTFKQNLGGDLTLFNKLDITANYFMEKTEGSIGSVTTTPSTGFNNYSDNIGDISSKGWELQARFNIISRPATRDNWSVFVNMFHVQGKIERVSNTLEEINKIANTTKSTTPVTRYAVGQSTTALWAVPSLGIDPSTGLEIYINRDGKLTTLYDPRDQVVAGDTRADVEGTFGTNLEIKGIGFNVFFRFRVGAQAYNQTLVDRVENVSYKFYNVDRRVYEQRWMKPGDLTFFKGFTNAAGQGVENTSLTSRFVQNDNLLACESISVYYRFSDQFNRKIKLQNTRVTFYTSDLFRLSSIKRERGIIYPFSHTYTLQLQTSF